MVKNVALVDNELQGKEYKGNQGGSGFGKFGELPKPKVLDWNIGNGIEYFVGSHNGFENIGVQYSRQVINVENDFWIVKDNFKSENEHTYKQVWQGHYSLEKAPNLIRSTFDDATGLDIYQLNAVDGVESSGKRGKQWTVVSKKQQGDFSFSTIIFPYKGFDNRIDELAKAPMLKGWKINNSDWKIEEENATTLSKGEEIIVISAKKIVFNNLVIESNEEGDFIIKMKDKKVTIQSISEKELQLTITGVKDCTLNGVSGNANFQISTGNILECKIE
ncbi:MAG: hypothetical protein WC389_14175 [Lutibacter sp.]|jgi:hypothetical protein